MKVLPPNTEIRFFVGSNMCRLSSMSLFQDIINYFVIKCGSSLSSTQPLLLFFKFKHRIKQKTLIKRNLKCLKCKCFALRLKLKEL